jgi:hypothetical protein
MTWLGLGPAALAGLTAGALAVVIVLYTVRWRLPRRVSATTSFWLRGSTRKRGGGRLSRIEHLRSLALQLTIALCLVGAAGGPRFACQSAGGSALAIVLDRSASMAAIERIEARLELARRRALGRLGTLAATDRVAVVLSGGEPEVAAPLSTDLAATRSALARATVRVGAGRLADAVTLACAMVSGLPHGAVLVVTDGSEPIGACPGAALETAVVGAAHPNLGITRFEAALPPRDPRAAEALVEVLNASQATARAELRVDLDGSLLRVLRLTLKPGASERRIIDGVPLTGQGRLVARLSAITFDGAPGDALPDDDVAYELVANRASIPVALVGHSAPVELALRSNPRYALREADAPASDTLDVIVGSLATPLPPGRHLLIDPSGPGAPAALGAAIELPRITYWRDEHPILRGLVLSDVVIGVARKVELPAGSTALAGSSDTPLLYTVAGADRRIAALGFDPASSNLPLRVSFPLLLYNALEWLRASDADEPDHWSVRAAAPVEVRDPAGRQQTLQPFAGRVRVVPEAAGFYQVSAGGKPIAQLAASVTNETETRITAEPRPGAAASGHFRDRNLSHGLALLALVLLIIEWSTYHRRRTV